MEYKVGDKFKCKKSLREQTLCQNSNNFIKNKTYTFVKHPVDDIYITLQGEFKITFFENKSKPVHDIIKELTKQLEVITPSIEEYFYSTSEIRKQKLQKIKNKENKLLTKIVKFFKTKLTF